jgi:hypothetical protein
MVMREHADLNLQARDGPEENPERGNEKNQPAVAQGHSLKMRQCGFRLGRIQRRGVWTQAIGVNPPASRPAGIP